jgi:hypothetical protein
MAVTILVPAHGARSSPKPIIDADLYILLVDEVETQRPLKSDVGSCHHYVEIGPMSRGKERSIIDWRIALVSIQMLCLIPV